MTSKFSYIDLTYLLRTSAVYYHQYHRLLSGVLLAVIALTLVKCGY